jgi:hypothetical protein
MHLVLNGINGEYLLDVLLKSKREDIELVEAAIAYATDGAPLFEWCWDNSVPLKFWGRFDETIPVSLPVLKTFLSRRSPAFTCKLIRSFHAKVIWWHGVGAYIGSANHTGAAWNTNIEAGTFFDEADIAAASLDVELRSFFDRIDEHASPLNDELYKALEERQKELNRSWQQDADARKKILAVASVKVFPGLVKTAPKSAKDRQRRAFLDDWYSTLQTLRDIGTMVGSDENRPAWIPASVPLGAQADQFLHAHYYNRVIGDDGRSYFAEWYENNRPNPAKALREAMDWWRDLPAAPSNESNMLFNWAPFLRNALSPDRILSLSPKDFEEVCQRVWSIQDHARRVSNATLNLAGGARIAMDIKTKALADFLMTRRAQNGSNVLEVINFVLYGGSEAELPERLWEATTNRAWKIEHLGISSLGELVGWAMPDRFPPRNNRTSKSLRSLGYNVTAHG